MIKAKKGLGQNFLIDKNIINKIVNTIDIKDKYILEIGPGDGNLTDKIIDGSVLNFQKNKYPLGLIMANSRRIGNIL